MYSEKTSQQAYLSSTFLSENSRVKLNKLLNWIKEKQSKCFSSNFQSKITNFSQAENTALAKRLGFPGSHVAYFFSFLFYLFIFFAAIYGIFIYLFFNFIFKLYNIVLVLQNIEMNPPQVYLCSPSWTLLSPPSPYPPSGWSQCTSPKHPVSCIEPRLATCFIHDIIHVSMPFSQISPPSPSPTESIRLIYTSVSHLLSRTGLLLSSF